MRSSKWMLTFVSIVIILSVLLSACEGLPADNQQAETSATSQPQTSAPTPVHEEVADSISTYPILDPSTMDILGYVILNHTNNTVSSINCDNPFKDIPKPGNKIERYCRDVQGLDLKSYTPERAVAIGASLTAEQWGRWVVGEEIVKNGAELILSRVLVLATLPLMLSGDTVQTKYAPLANTWSGNVWMSTHHGEPVPGYGKALGTESKMVIESILAAATPQRRLGKKGNGQNDGDVTLYFGKDAADPTLGHVAILLTTAGGHVFFAVLSGSIDNIGYSCPKGGCLSFKDGTVLDPSKLLWNCAWVFANRDWNSHKAAPPDTWMDIGQSWQQWEFVKTKYQPLFEIVNVSIVIPKLDIKNLMR